MGNHFAKGKKLIDRPIEERIARFPRRPDERELGTDLGYGLMGSSNIELNEDERSVRVEPQQIPIKIATVWMYFVLAFIAAVLLWIGDKDTMIWVMLVFAGIIIIPTMMAVLSWLNEKTGTEPFLVYNKSSDRITLPRVELAFAKEQLREIVFLDRFVDENRFWQVALLVEVDGSWTYVHLFNGAGATTGMKVFGCKELYERLADRLEIESRLVKFTRQESRKSLSLPL